jgi:hypothetical protein
MTVAKALPADVIDSLLSGYKKPEDLIGEHGLLKQITKALVERALVPVLKDIRTLHENRDAEFQHTLFLVRHITEMCSESSQEKKLPH